MSIGDAKGKVQDKIPIDTVLVSVFDKDGLENLVPSLVQLNPNVKFLSTGELMGELLRF